MRNEEIRIGASELYLNAAHLYSNQLNEVACTTFLDLLCLSGTADCFDTGSDLCLTYYL
jgi:hypothetical protein